MNGQELPMPKKHTGIDDSKLEVEEGPLVLVSHYHCDHVGSGCDERGVDVHLPKNSQN
jgi:hypothetical protein